MLVALQLAAVVLLAFGVVAMYYRLAVFGTLSKKRPSDAFQRLVTVERIGMAAGLTLWCVAWWMGRQ